MTWQFLFSRLECKNCTFPDIHRYFNSQLPCKANGTPMDSSLGILISLKVSQSTRSEDPYFLPVLFFLLYVYEMFERNTQGPASPSKMYLSYMRLCSSQFLSETCLHNLSNTNVVLNKIVRYSKDLGIAGCLPTARESCDGLSLQSAKFCAGP